MLFLIARLQIKLWVKGDALFYVYLFSLVSFVFFYIVSVELLWQIFLLMSNLYLVMLYNRDIKLGIFYKLMNISEFKIHAVKVCITYVLSFIQLLVFVILTNKENQPILFITHFLSFYTILLFSNTKTWYKLVYFISIFTAISFMLSIFPMYITTIAMLIFVTFLLIPKFYESFT